MIAQTLHDLMYGFSIAAMPQNLLWSFVGVLVGNLIGVLPGMGALSAIAMLLPLTYSMHAVPALLMLAGIFYGSQYGGALGAILLNLPSHPPHAVTCIDGYPMTRQGRGGTALGITMVSSFFAASVGIIVMIFLSPWLVKIAFDFGPTEIVAIMLLGLIAGATMSRGSRLKGIAMTVFGLLLGIVGTDVNSGVERFTFGFAELSDKVELVALSMGLFGVADFLINVNRISFVGTQTKVRLRDMRPSRGELKQAFWPMVRGTFVGTLFGAMPGTGPTITTFLAYALEKKIAKLPERFGRGAIEGVASPEASTHAKTQVDFIPTMTLGIPGDAVMALLLGALLIQGFQPGPQLITQHADLFWGLIASFWIGNVLLVVLNVPLIGVWVKLLQVPYRLMYPSALFFIAVGVFSTNNSLFEVGEVLVFGIIGAVLLALDFPVATILLGYVLGPMVEENFRRALLLSRGDLAIFVQRPISAAFVAICALMIIGQCFFAWREHRSKHLQAASPGLTTPPMSRAPLTEE
ncbi:tripartite tricarboxylate transporter permease [Burkholderia multivorans]|uniref:tripartite tricarboxylate transporter permease n=1 Tax=Burkholderia multivorans TaxID=87883 RepID=UPI0018DD23A2|nr:tripartite tricarboxylate transporter permease [Burkholderia multivorans]MBH9664523.1 tripartite tricarboxylate transporter permease [Burkholderia multivorans]MBU9366590.1 tripartite tricarboxylate transporter permease [Burkholderia multivorans]MBU9597113.1 tripartite tricarboxylate transporter permease [Burkholderia multivorans]MBU9651179.1 tripartite tricarboxylate transporter permease [Burkholderia multivorans]MCA8487943.1 tripartite tricarboxylate transporter permease [Burkholderia mult